MTLQADAPPGRPDAPLLLLTKLHPPVVPAQSIARERLFQRLGDGRGRRLRLVACPAGFGKSTLLAAWREAESAERPVAWVTLDEGDNDDVVVWSHVIEALGRVCPGLADRALPAIVAAAPVLEVVLPRLVNELVEQGEVALVLDDFHRLSGACARRGAGRRRRTGGGAARARAGRPAAPAGGQQLDLVDGLIALAPVAAIVDRARAMDLFDEAGSILGGCPDPGALPGRFAAARRTAG